MLLTNSQEMEINSCESSHNASSSTKSILDCVAKSDGFFKSQQVNEIDLTFSEKREIASNILDTNVPLFLQRYWKFIKLEDVSYFEPYKEDYEVNFYLTEIAKLRNSQKNKTRIRNRRYEALKQMVKEGHYFSDSEMRKRNPFLYEQFIGKHLTENERIAAYRETHKDERFSTFLMNQMERNVENRLFEEQEDADNACMEEVDETDDEEESELEDDVPSTNISVVTDEEKSLLRNEFTNIMYEEFIGGKDKDFDYSSIDDNVEYDPLYQLDKDEEEKYFDED